MLIFASYRASLAFGVPMHWLSSPLMSIASWALSVASVLSSSATEKEKIWAFFCNRLQLLCESLSIRPVTVFAERDSETSIFFFFETQYQQLACSLNIYHTILVKPCTVRCCAWILSESRYQKGQRAQKLLLPACRFTHACVHQWMMTEADFPVTKFLCRATKQPFPLQCDVSLGTWQIPVRDWNNAI